MNAKLDDGATGPDSPSIAVPPATLYLHGDGPPANPVNLTLNNDQPTNPQSQTKRKDSPPINFNSGNLWKEVGTWTTLAVNTTPAELEVWLGLKNTDDTNTAFDLQVVVNGDLDHPAGLTRCIIGLRNGVNLAKLVKVEDLEFEGGTMSITLRTRIGTNPNGSRCSGRDASHSNATGLRVWFDSTTRASKLEVQP